MGARRNFEPDRRAPRRDSPRRIGGFKIKLSTEKSILKLAVDKQIKLSESDFGRLSTAFFAELKAQVRVDRCLN